MATIQNARDTLLQATSPRIYPLGLPVGTIIDYGDLAPGLGSDIAAAIANSNTAIAAVGVIADDSLLSGLEKKAVRVEWEAIVAERTLIEAQATTFSVSFTSFRNAFIALATYLNNGVTWTTGVPNWITDSNIGANQTIVAATYRAKWTAYYTQRVILIKAVTDAANAKAAAAAVTAVWSNVTGSGKPANNATVNNGLLANLAGQITAANYATYLGANAITVLGFNQNQTISTSSLSTSVDVDSNGQHVVIIFSGRLATSQLASTTGVQYLNALITVNGVTKYNDQIGRLAHLQVAGQYQQGSYSEFLIVPAPSVNAASYTLTISTAASVAGANNSSCAWPSLLVIGLKR
jgi:hypothetical protein